MSDFNLQTLDLYQQLYLVDEPQIAPVKENKKIENTLRFSGSAQKRLLFVYHEPQNWNDADEKMIQTLITNGLKLALEDIMLLNLFENNTPDWQTIVSELKPEKIIFWNCDAYAEAASLAKQTYTVHQNEDYRYLLVHAASAFHDDKDLKTKLWISIKSLFQLP
jgi:hypothetical protein